MNTFLEGHSATDFVTILKEKLKKAKDGKREEETIKEREEGRERERKRRREEMIEEDEARRSPVKSQEQLTSSVLQLGRNPTVKRVMWRTVHYYRPPSPWTSSPPSQVQRIPRMDFLVQTDQEITPKTAAKYIQGALHAPVMMGPQCWPWRRTSRTPSTRISTGRWGGALQGGYISRGRGDVFLLPHPRHRPLWLWKMSW